MAMVQLQSYNFSTVENPLSNGGNFTGVNDANLSPGLQVVSGNLCEPTALTTADAAFWSGTVNQTGDSWPADQYSEITLTTWATASDIAYLLVRQGSATSGTQYLANIQRASGGSTGSSVLFAVVGGTVHTLNTQSSLTTAPGDIWRLTVVGNVLTMNRNGAQVYTFTDTNNYIVSGAPGFGLYSPTALTNTQTGLWAAGGNQAATPTFNPVAGSYATAQNVQISSSTPGGLIYYTTNGSTPTHSSSSIANGGTVTVSTPLTIKAFASVTDFADSATGSATYSGSLTPGNNSSWLSVNNNNALRGSRSH